jgi:TonB family protein
MTQQPAPKRNTGGLIIVVLLGVVFFVLLSLLVCSTGKRRGTRQSSRAETLTVIATRIRLRTEPNAKAAVVTTATSGEQLALLEDRGAWVRVQDPDGLVGWADRSALERTAERERRLARYEAIRKLPPIHGVASERTTLYAGPGIFYPIVGELAGHADVRVFTRDHDFYAVDYGGAVAYADIDAIEVMAEGSRQLDVATTPQETASETAAPVPPAETASEPPPEVAQPAPAPVPADVNSGGVYAAVPPGGTQPEEVDRVTPRYPPAARMAGASGSVVIRGIVRKDGTIDEVEILKDQPYGLGEAARDAVERWRFRPATYRGEPIDVYYTVTVNFRLR